MPSTPRSSANSNTKAKEGIVLIISSPSGAGKTTICHRLLEKLPDLRFNISHTTRSPRKNEVDGQDYFFISEKQFKTMQERGEFLEWARYSDNFYGTSIETINSSRDNGQDVLLELDIQGVESLRKLNYPGVSIFILPPSMQELVARLKNRATESEKIINQRIERGTKEISACGSFDYILTNHEVEQCVDQIITILQAEKLKAERFIPPSPDIQALLKSNEKD